MSCADLRERGAEIVRVLCVIDREAGGAAALQAEGLDLHALFTMTELVATQPTATQPAGPSSR